MEKEQRVIALEKENAELKRQLEVRHKGKRWLRAILDETLWRILVLLMFLKILGKISG